MKNIYQPIVLLMVFSLVNLTSFLAQTQTGPGGVGTSSTVSVWYDASKQSFANGDVVTSWSDFSGNNNSANQVTSGQEPTFVSSSANLNNRPALSFDGNDFLQSNAISSLNTDVVTFFTVFANSGAFTFNGQQRGVFEVKTTTVIGAPLYGIYLQRVNNLTGTLASFSRDASNTIKFAQAQFLTAEYNAPRISTSLWRSSNNLNHFTNGTSGTSNTGLTAASGTHEFISIGKRIPSASFFQGDLGEIIIYNAELNTAQVKIVNNYLNSKYAITIGAMDLFSFESTHAEELAGIGRDDASNQHLSARGSSIVQIESSSLDNNDFLLWAHNNDVLSTNLVDVPAAYLTTFGERMSRTWVASETGETGTVTVTYDLTGIQFGHPDDYELLIDADGDFTSGTTVIPGTLVGDEVSFTVTGAQLSSGNFFTIANSNASVIRSIVSGQNWNQTSTWSCSCIPLITDYVTISDNHIVTLSDNQNAAMLTVNSNGELSITNSGFLNIAENINVIGTIVSDPAGTINFMGSALQTVNTNGTINFGSLTTNNSATGVQLQTGNFTLSGTLTLTDGDLDVGGNQFTFTSSASGTAAIDILTGAATMLNTGNVRVQRFIPAGVAGYRNIGTPQTNMPLEEWDNELFISGPGFPDGCSFSSNGCYRSARLWNATTQQYVGIDNISTLIPNGTGVEIWLGDNLTSFGQNTLTSSGDINLNLSTNITIRNGWNLVSNPFLAPIDFDNIVRNSAGTGNYHYVWDPSTNGFQFWDGGAQSASVAQLNNGILSAFQGFWVFHSGANTTITINQSAKSIGSTDQFLRQESNSSVLNYFDITLSSSKLGVQTKAGVKFNEGDNNHFESLDIPKLPYQMVDSKAIFLYTKTTDGNEVVVNNLSQTEDCFTQPLYFDLNQEGSYTISFNHLPREYTVYIVDKVSGSRTKLEENLEVEFTQISELIGVNRFDLIYQKDTKCNEIDNDFTLKLNYSAGILNLLYEEISNVYSFEITNLLGQKTYISNSFEDKEFSKNIAVQLNNGMYIVNILNQNGDVVGTQKLVVSE